MNSVKEIVDAYPADVQVMFNSIRDLIYDVAEHKGLKDIEETLKWREPAYLVKGGSTLRIDWKEKSPDYIHLYFNCNTILVETFREVFFDIFEFESNRAIKLPINESLPTGELKQCIDVTLRYHRVKHLTLLGF